MTGSNEAVLLIGDIGGTNARFALADAAGAGFSDEVCLNCADFETSDQAIDHYLSAVKASRPDVVCIAAAGPIIDRSVVFTNSDWRISEQELGKRFDTSQVQLLNDFEAIAWSLPLLDAHHRMAIGSRDVLVHDSDDYVIAVLGPGTGLGMAGLKKSGDQLFPISTEGGHVGFAPESDKQLEVLAKLHEYFKRVSLERLVSGQGLSNVYDAMTALAGRPLSRSSPREIFERAHDDTDPLAAEAVQFFFEVLGQAAGDFALSIGVDKGVFIAGGIVKRYPEMFASSRFREGFENKGRYRSLMESIPTSLVMHDQPGLLGASYCARRLLHALVA